MQLKRLRKLIKKQFRLRRKQITVLSRATEHSIENDVFKRFLRLGAVRRFVMGWVFLMLLLVGGLILQLRGLGGYYLAAQPGIGGIYSEGIVGSISNVNPLYANSEADRSLSRLMFAGLLGYDVNGKLVPVMAESIVSSENGRLYTLVLRSGLTWHDGQPFTSSDVVYTFNTIKNPDARSPLQQTWKDITVAAPNERTVTFRLPGSLASFPYTLTTGIVPKHILGKVEAGSLRSNQFNTTKPVGTGPFSWRGLQVSGTRASDVLEQVALLPFDKYVNGAPALSEFIVKVYGSKEKLEQAFASGQLTAASGLQTVPTNSPDTAEARSLLVKAGSYAFFKNSNPTLSSVKVRQALVAASNPKEIIDGLGYMTRPVKGPLLSGQVGYNKDYVQKTNDVPAARRLLMEDGWQPGSGNTMAKNGQPLQFNLVIANTREQRGVAKKLIAQWNAVGAKVTLRALPIEEYAIALQDHDFDVTIHGISIGEDPDVYAYWHSSQADVRSASRLNLSEWKNTAADQSLEAGRTRSNGQLRAVKYVPFLQAWQQEAPALGLYQPRIAYLTRDTVYGLTDKTITGSVDRYNGVEKWQIRSSKQIDTN